MIVMLVGVASCLVAQGPSRPVILGILEELPAAYIENPPLIRDVQVVFKKAGDDWIAYPNDCPDKNCVMASAEDFPKEITWTVTFDGKSLGEITGRTQTKSGSFWREGQQEITSRTPVPTVGKRSMEFGGQLDLEVYRPLVAVSQSSFRDPDVWKPAVLTPTVLSGLRKGFRRHFPMLCRSSATHESQLVPFPYHDDEVKVARSYASRRGWRIARLHLEGAIDCEDTEAGFDIDDPWFVMNDKREVRYLASGMFLVDAGDYDSDGESEIIFSINSNNRGGFRIFYDDFKKTAEFEFSYH